MQDVYFLQNASLSAEFASSDLSRLSITTSEGKKCTFKIEDVKEFRDIEAALTTIVHNVNGSKPVFGMHLSELLLIEKSKIPEVLVRIAEVILPSIETKGLFRVSGHAEVISDLLVKFNTHQWKPEDADGVSVHNYCSVFKTFFSMLPEPLLTFKGYDKAAAFLNESSEVSEDEVKSFTRSLIKSLPESNRNVAEFLFDFLAKVSLKSDKNMMTVTNLGIVFTPPLLRPRSESIEDAMLSVKMAELVSTIIEERAVRLNEEKQEKSSSTGKTKDKRSKRKGHKKLSRTLRINKLVAKRAAALDDGTADGASVPAGSVDIAPPAEAPPAERIGRDTAPTRHSAAGKSGSSGRRHTSTAHSLHSSSSGERDGAAHESSESSTSSECSRAKKGELRRSSVSQRARKQSPVLPEGGAARGNDIAPPPMPPLPPPHAELKKSSSIGNVTQLQPAARCSCKSSLALAPPPLAPGSGGTKRGSGDGAKHLRASSHAHRKMSVPTLPPPQEGKAAPGDIPPPASDSPSGRQHAEPGVPPGAPPISHAPTAPQVGPTSLQQQRNSPLPPPHPEAPSQKNFIPPPGAQ